MTIGERVAQIRKEAGLSMAAFGHRLAVTSGTISMWEHDQRNLSDQAVKMLCQEFSVNEEWLRFGIGEKEAAQYKSRFIDLALQLDLSSDKYDLQTKDMASELIELWMGLDKNNKQVLFDVIDQLKSQIKKD